MCDQQCEASRSRPVKMADRQTDFLPNDGTGRGHSTWDIPDVQRLSHIIKAELRAYDLSGQGHRQENEDSLFLIGQPPLDSLFFFFK